MVHVDGATLDRDYFKDWAQQKAYEMGRGQQQWLLNDFEREKAQLNEKYENQLREMTQLNEERIQYLKREISDLRVNKYQTNYKMNKLARKLRAVEAISGLKAGSDSEYNFNSGDEVLSSGE